MNEFNELKKVVDKILGKYDPKIYIQGASIVSEEDLNFHIAQAPIHSLTSLSGGNMRISVAGHNVISLNMVHFPSCCGKCIIHALYVSDEWWSKEDKVVKLSKEEMFELWVHALRFIKYCISYLAYSSMMLIVSANEQPYIKSLMDMTKLKPSFEFKNRRYKPPHNIYEYNIEFSETQIE